MDIARIFVGVAMTLGACIVLTLLLGAAFDASKPKMRPTHVYMGSYR